MASSPSRRTERARIRFATFEQAMTKTSADAASSTSRTVLAGEMIWSRSRTASMRKSASLGYASGCSLTIAPWTARSSARAASRSAPGASRPKSSVIRCTRPSTIVADRWCGLVTTLAMISVSAGYGMDGSRTPTMVAERSPSRIVFPITDGIALERGASRSGGSAPRRPRPPARRPPGRAAGPSTGRSPMTSKYDRRRPRRGPRAARRGRSS